MNTPDAVPTAPPDLNPQPQNQKRGMPITAWLAIFCGIAAAAAVVYVHLTDKPEVKTVVAPEATEFLDVEPPIGLSDKSPTAVVVDQATDLTKTVEVEVADDEYQHFNSEELTKTELPLVVTNGNSVVTGKTETVYRSNISQGFGPHFTPAVPVQVTVIVTNPSSAMALAPQGVQAKTDGGAIRTAQIVGHYGSDTPNGGRTSSSNRRRVTTIESWRLPSPARVYPAPNVQLLLPPVYPVNGDNPTP